MGLPVILSGGKALLALIGDLGTKQPERINQLADGALAHPLRTGEGVLSGRDGQVGGEEAHCRACRSNIDVGG